jgi:hypothetical protein
MMAGSVPTTMLRQYHLPSPSSFGSYCDCLRQIIIELILEHVSAQHLKEGKVLDYIHEYQYSQVASPHLSTDTALLHIFGFKAKSIYQGSIEGDGIILKSSRLPKKCSICVA